MIKVGIDTLAIYTSRYALDLETLAHVRGADPEKYSVGLGQESMSVPPPGEDIVTMAANAAQQALQGVDLNSIEMLLFATESSIDQSKAAGLYVHELLKLPARCRVVELKQACYAGTAAIQLALPFLRENPDKKILVLASDIARYGLATSGESSQGAAAAAILLSANPRVLAFEYEYGVVAESVMDFWRPNYFHEALVDGKYSSKLYLQMLEKTWKQYQDSSGRSFHDHAYFCYHTPVPRLVEKAHQHLLKINGICEDWSKQLAYSLKYGRQTGNSYTAALYISLASLLDHAEEDLNAKRIGFYSYGSGCVAEFFSAVVQPHYRSALHTDYHAKLLAAREQLTYAEYESFYQFPYQEDGSEQDIPEFNTGCFRLSKLQNHKRVYEKVIPDRENVITETFATTTYKKPEPQNLHIRKVFAPGKLILSGEHAVVYGAPALAMAINRYVTATVSQESSAQIKFDLADLAYDNHVSLSALKFLKNKIKNKYHRFIRGDFSIREVLQKPFELAQFALGLFTESLNVALPQGVKIKIQSDIPIGCGMGSSAATILSVMHAVSYYLGISVSQETLLKLALEAENMQHGHSSGLDLRVASQGGCIYMQGGELQVRDIPVLPMYLINTGAPETSTGQCVEQVAKYFKTSQLKNEFAAVTKAMDQALKEQSWTNMQEAIRHNHQLLVKIGVVPEKVQQFISQVETIHGAAKICGAGAVAGNKAGAVLVVAEDNHVLTQLSDRFGYNVIPISAELRGVHAA